MDRLAAEQERDHFIVTKRLQRKIEEKLELNKRVIDMQHDLEYKIADIDEEKKKSKIT